MSNYRAGADRGNKLASARGFKGGSHGPAGPGVSLIHDARVLVRVVAPHFVAGLIMTAGRCTEAAPILKYAIGKERDELRRYFTSKGWKATIVLPKVERDAEKS